MESGGEFTVVELKEALRERGLATYGTKAELIKRLSEKDPKVWNELTVRRGIILDVTDSSNSGGRHRSMEDGEAVEENEIVNGAMAREEHTGIEELNRERGDNIMRMELVLLRREKELWERERQLLGRELEMLRGSLTTMSTTPSGITLAPGGVRGIKDLLPEFDGMDNVFWRWKQQLQLLRDSYHLDENSTRILISSRLKGRALSWFHSKAEYLTLDIEGLLKEMERMFDLRPGRLTLRREFEARTWKKGESFFDYYHDKVILANQIPIAEDEILDYIVEGVTDQRLQNQARMMNY